MTGRESPGAPSAVGKLQFAPTHWSVVLAAAEQPSSASVAAREQLCRHYWFPLYAYVRRRGYGPEDAQDLTQEFFARLLTNDGLRRVSPLKGKFRSFLLASMNHLLSDEQDRATRKKRGGGQAILSFDAPAAEERYRLEPADELTPEKVFERRWAVGLLEQALDRLETDYSRAGKHELFEVLQHFLTGDGQSGEYPAAARKLGLTEGAMRVAVHRLRKRFGAVFRELVAETIDSPDEVEAEMQHLLALLRG